MVDSYSKGSGNAFSLTKENDLLSSLGATKPFKPSTGAVITRTVFDLLSAVLFYFAIMAVWNWSVAAYWDVAVIGFGQAFSAALLFSAFTSSVFISILVYAQEIVSPRKRHEILNGYVVTKYVLFLMLIGMAAISGALA